MSKSNELGANPTAKKVIAPTKEEAKVMKAHNCGKGQAQIRLKIDILTNKRDGEGLNMMEIKCLLNNKEKLDCKSPSRIYKNLERMNPEDRVLIMGASAFPTFGDFRGMLPEGKALFSMWDGFGVLVKCNKQAQTKSKVDAQGGKIIKEGKKAA